MHRFMAQLAIIQGSPIEENKREERYGVKAARRETTSMD